VTAAGSGRGSSLFGRLEGGGLVLTRAYCGRSDLDGLEHSYSWSGDGDSEDGDLLTTNEDEDNLCVDVVRKCGCRNRTGNSTTTATTMGLMPTPEGVGEASVPMRPVLSYCSLV